MTAERTATLNALIALVRVVDLGIDTRRALSSKQIAEVSRWRNRDEQIGLAIARTEAVRLAKRVAELDGDIAANTATMTNLVRQNRAAVLLGKNGIGPVTAAIALTAWSHPGRIRSEAAFAALAGTSPIPAPSGNTVRHRLNRGGDRRLNRALHIATITRMTHDPATRAYVEKRTTEGPHRQRDPPMPQALSRPPDLPRAQRRRRHTRPGLTNIEGSLVLGQPELRPERVVVRDPPGDRSSSARS